MPITIKAEPRELAELMVAIRDGEFGSDPAARYYSKEDARLEVAGEELAKTQEERDEAFALAAIYPLTLEDLAGKTVEELEQLLADRSVAIRRGLQAMTTGELIAEFKRRNGVEVIPVESGYPFHVYVDDNTFQDVGPATVLVINGK